MSSWVCIPCLLVLRNEFNLVSPKRDKGADGTIGDAKHSPSSDHSPDEDSSVLRNKDADKVNEVHALDVDSTGPWPDGKRGDIKGSWFDKKIHALIAEERRRWLDPDDMCRLHYIIWMRVIYSTSNDFEGEPYDGEDPHTDHAHFSGRYETRAENDTRPWGVYIAPEEIPVDQKTYNALFLGALKDPAIRAEVGEAMLEANIGSTSVPTRTVREALKDIANQLRPAFVFPPNHRENTTSGLPADAPIRSLLAVASNLSSVASQLSALTTTVNTIKNKFTSS